MSTAAPALFAYDGSEGSQRALTQGAERLSTREAVVVCVWASVERSAGLGRLALPDEVTRQAIENLDAEAEREAQGVAEQGAAVLRDLGWSATARTRSTTTNAWAALLAVAEEVGAGTIVTGSRGYGTLKATLLGSVSAGLAQHSPVPVLIAK